MTFFRKGMPHLSDRKRAQASGGRARPEPGTIRV